MDVAGFGWKEIETLSVLIAGLLALIGLVIELREEAKRDAKISKIEAEVKNIYYLFETKE